jgi:hypothetical protein
MKITLATTAVLTSLWLLAACGGSSHPSAQASSAAHTLSYGQGAKICNDLMQAQNQDMPRFNSTLTADENLAVNDKSALGNDLVTEDNDLQADNGLALIPGAIYNEEGVSNTNALKRLAHLEGIADTDSPPYWAAFRDDLIRNAGQLARYKDELADDEDEDVRILAELTAVRLQDIIAWWIALHPGWPNVR